MCATPRSCLLKRKPFPFCHSLFPLSAGWNTGAGGEAALITKTMIPLVGMVGELDRNNPAPGWSVEHRQLKSERETHLSLVGAGVVGYSVGKREGESVFFATAAKPVS